MQMKCGKFDGKFQKKVIEIVVSVQVYFEKFVEEFGFRFKGYFFLVVYVGGVVQNVKVNVVLRYVFGDENIWVFLVMDDGGLVFGVVIFVKV